MNTAGAFPFWRRGDERANSIVRLQQIFPRILAAEYDPPEASPPCLHLLRSLLCSDPMRRADISGIMNHPWCEARVLFGALPVPSVQRTTLWPAIRLLTKCQQCHARSHAAQTRCCNSAGSSRIS